MDNLSAWNQFANVMQSAAATVVQAADSRKGRSWATDENEKSREYQTEMWNKATEYNSPSAVMSRLESAGINPNSMFGFGAAASTPSAPSTQSPSFKSYDFSLANPNNENIQYELAQEELRARRIENDYRAEGLTLTQSEQRAALKKIDADIRLLLSNGDLSEVNADILRRSADSIVAKSKTDLDMIMSEIDNNKAKYDNIRAELSLLRKQGVNIDEDTRAKELSNQLQQAKNDLRTKLYDLGIDPESHGFDRFLEFLLDSDKGRQIIDNLLNTTNRLLSGRGVTSSSKPRWRAPLGRVNYNVVSSGVRP